MNNVLEDTNAITGRVGSHDGESLPTIRHRMIDNYDVAASYYDTARSTSWHHDWYFDQSYRTLDQWIGPTDDYTVHLDMPVGTGRFLAYLQDRGRRHRMIGIDISDGMLRVCRQQTARRQCDVTLSIGDAFQLPLSDASVDVLTSLRLFHLFPARHWPAMLAEMHRVIRPGGFLITEFRNAARGTACHLLSGSFRRRRADHPHYFATPQRVRRLFDAWSNVKMEGVGLDGLGRLKRVSTSLADRLSALQSRTAVKYLSKVLLVKAHKPATRLCF